VDLHEGVVDPFAPATTRRWAASSCMPRLGSSLEGRDEGKKRRSHPLGRGGSPPGGTNNNNNNNNADGGYQHGNSINIDDDSFRSSHHGDDEEQDRLLPSSNSSVNRPAARRVHSAYAGAAGCNNSGNLSSRWVGIVVLVTVGLILRNALVNVRSTQAYQERACSALGFLPMRMHASPLLVSFRRTTGAR
jgi:hypothetical protein